MVQLGMNKYLSRVTSSARGEVFNPLVWPFLFATFAYAVGFAFFSGNDGVDKSSLFEAMNDINTHAPTIWGIIALVTLGMGITFLMFNIPPAGKASGLIGFSLWLWAAFCWALTGGWLLVISIALPNLWFWFWQYLSLSNFRHEDAEDKATMRDYDTGGYDDELHPKSAKIDRKNNRGVSEQ